MTYRSGFVGLIGQPNAGKSTLMNYLIEQKVSIVTAKPQTTRRRILGIHTTDREQIIFIDAPGVIKAEKGLNAFLEKEAEDVMRESDAILAVVSVDEKSADSNQKILEMVKASKKPWIGLITKTDVDAKAHRILILKNMIEEMGAKCLQVSCLKDGKEGRELVLENLVSLLPEAPGPLYEDDLYTTENVRDLIAEIIREKCFLNLEHEIPYQIAIQIRKFDENKKPCPHIYADVLVGKDSHKPIVVGKNATVIKKISQQSREEVEKLMDEKVFLELNVVVKENWYEHKQTMKELGYVSERK